MSVAGLYDLLAFKFFTELRVALDMLRSLSVRCMFMGRSKALGLSYTGSFSDQSPVSCLSSGFFVRSPGV